MSDIIAVMNTKGLTDRQIMEQIRLIFLRRKRAEGLSQTALAVDVGVGRSTLWYAINKKVASRAVITKLKIYLDMNSRST